MTTHQPPQEPVDVVTEQCSSCNTPIANGIRSCCTDCSDSSLHPEITDRIESLVSYGQPTCDVCWALSRDDRPDGDGGFWPAAPIRYINNNKDALCDWNARTVCRHHDSAAHIPEQATHRALTVPEYIGDEHRMNSAYANHVLEVVKVNTE